MERIYILRLQHSLIKLVALGAILVLSNVAEIRAADKSSAPDFARDIFPIFRRHCFECHGEKEQEADLRLDQRDNFNTYFTVTNSPGQANYKLTSLLPSPAPSLKSRGDFNGDGKVDGADYAIWRKTLGSTTNLQADANGSLNIDAGDYIHWRDNFGAPPGSGSGVLGAVPEPGTTMLTLVGLISLWAFKRR